jgi:dihydropteroate synthase
MGVLNVTPDSFSDGGRFAGPDEAIAAGVRLAEEGAALIDVGGESTRPGAAEIPLAEELRRVIPVLAGLNGRTGALLSVDTSKPEVMSAAAEAGADLINDVRALAAPGALAAARATGCGVCLMHMQGEPRTMQQDPRYADVVAEVRAFLAARVAAAQAAGFAAEELLLDPGFGFGKTVAHNLALLRELPQLTTLGPAVLVGLSRKAMLGKLTAREASATLP